MAETEVDPRIALLTAQDRRLLMVGQGTMGMMLAAAEKAGLIPKCFVTTEYGALRTPADYVYPQRNAVEALEQARLMNEQVRDTSLPGGVTAVSRVRTRYPEAVTDWAPLTAEETNA